MNLVHVARLSVGGFACTDWMLAHPDASFSRDGWTAGLVVEHSDAHLSITSADGDTVVLSTATPRGAGSVLVACACLPVADLHALFDPCDPAHEHAWECLARLHARTSSLAALSTSLSEREQRALLSWAALPPDQAARWQAAGAVSGATALALSRDGITPEQAEPFERMGWVLGGRWTRNDIVCFVRHQLSADDARAWLATHLPRRAIPLFVEHGYTPDQAADLVQAGREAGNPDTVTLHDWITPRIDPAVAATAVRAGLTPAEASDPHLDLDTITVLVALRQQVDPTVLPEAI